MDEHLYVVTYDIRSPRRWRRVFKMMHGYGQWLQLSVFQCRLDRRRHVQLVAALGEALNLDEDHALILDLGSIEKVELKVNSLGRVFEPVAREAIVV
jgi:CRISPR-associated protein Cas2